MHRVVCAHLQLDLSQASDPLLAYLASTWCVNTAGSYSGIADYLNDVWIYMLLYIAAIYMLSYIFLVYCTSYSIASPSLHHNCAQ